MCDLRKVALRCVSFVSVNITVVVCCVIMSLLVLFVLF